MLNLRSRTTSHRPDSSTDLIGEKLGCHRRIYASRHSYHNYAYAIKGQLAAKTISIQHAERTTIPFPRYKARRMGSEQRERAEYRRSPSLHQAPNPGRRSSQAKFGEHRPSSDRVVVGHGQVAVVIGIEVAGRRNVGRKDGMDASGPAVADFRQVHGLLFSRMTTWGSPPSQSNPDRHGCCRPHTPDDKGPCPSQKYFPTP